MLVLWGNPLKKWTLVHSCGMLYLERTCLEIMSELTLACGNNSTSFPKVIGDVKGCILVKSSTHPEMKIAFPVPLTEITTFSIHVLKILHVYVARSHIHTSFVNLRVCKANSLVGVKISPRAPVARCVFSLSNRGMRKAAVFPLPVLAMATTSFPSMITGTVFRWMGVGILYPFRMIPLKTPCDRPAKSWQ